MNLTQEEFVAVAVYEKQLQAVVRSKYLRNVGQSGLDVLVPIYERIAGVRYPVNSNCAACIFGFLQRIGAIYFADKEEQETVADGNIHKEDQQAAIATEPRPIRGSRCGRRAASSK